MTSPRRALIVVDAQREYFDGPLAIQHPPVEESIANIIRTVAAASEQAIPIVVVRHEESSDAPVFAAGTPGAELHPDLERQLVGVEATAVPKTQSSVFEGTGLAERLREQGIDTVTLVGYMTNNCILASAAAAEPLGLAVEVLDDATGAIHIVNDAGAISARDVHESLMTILHSSFAAVADTDRWISAIATGDALPKSDLGSSATRGHETYE